MNALKNIKFQSFFKRELSLQSETPVSFLHSEKSNRFSIKNIIMNVKLKQRVSQIVKNLTSRRFKMLTPFLLNKINDNSYSYANESKVQMNLNGDLDRSMQRNSNYEACILKKIQPQIEQSSSSKIQKVLIEQMRQLFTRIPIIDPNSIYKIFWDLLQCLIIVLLFTITPLKLAVQDYSLSYYLGSDTSLFFIIVLIVMDILINLNTAFFRNGKIEVVRSQIIKKYLQQVGVCDILITQSLIYLLSYEKNKNKDNLNNTTFYTLQQILLLSLVYYKSSKFNKYLIKIEETFSFKRRTLNMLSLVKLLFFILKVAHAFSCLWLYIGRIDAQRSWIKGKEDGWLIEYLRAYYFITVTMTTIGYGDIIPTNSLEMLVSIFSMIIACGVFGYTINSIGSIFLELKKEGEEKQENLFIINHYMSENNISRELQYSIREYLEYYWSQWKDENSEREQRIFYQLSQDIRISLLLQANSMIIKDCQLFQKNFTQKAIQKFVQIIKEKKLTPNEYLINSTEDISNSGIIFFVQKGEIDIYQEFSLDSTYSCYSSSADSPSQQQEKQQSSQQNQKKDNNQCSIMSICDTRRFQKQQNQEGYNLINTKTTNRSSIMPISSTINQNSNTGLQNNEQHLKERRKYKKHVQTLKEGEYFGEMSFFTNFPNKFIAKSRNFSKVLCIDRSKFIDLLKQNNFQEDFETFCNIRDSINQNELQCLYQICQFCQSQDHTPLQCPIVHFLPQHQQLIYKHNFSQDITQRKYIQRRKILIKNTLKTLQSNYLIAENFIEKNETYIEQNIKLFDYSQTEISDDFTEDDEEYEDEDQEEEDDDDQEEVGEEQDEKNIFKKFNKKFNFKSASHKQIMFVDEKYDEIYHQWKQNDQYRNQNASSQRSIINSTHFNEKKKKNDQQKSKQKIKIPQVSLQRIHNEQPSSPYQFQNKSEFSINRNNNSSQRSINANYMKDPFQEPNSLNINKEHAYAGNQNSSSLMKKQLLYSLLEPQDLHLQKNISAGIVSHHQIKERAHHSNSKLEKQRAVTCIFNRNEGQKSIIKEKDNIQFSDQDQNQNQRKESQDKIINKDQTQQKTQQLEKQKTQQLEKQNNQQNIEMRNYSILDFFNWDVKFDSLFENMKIFKNYFPHNNYDKIILKLKKKRLIENNILKLSLINKQTLLKKRDSKLQFLKNQVNAFRFQYKLSSIRIKKSSLNSPNRSSFQFENSMSNIDKSYNPTKQLLVEDQEIVSENQVQESTNLKINKISQKNIKSNFLKNDCPLKDSGNSNFLKRMKSSQQNDNCFKFNNEDYNLINSKECLTNKIIIKRQQRKNINNFSKGLAEYNKGYNSD